MKIVHELHTLPQVGGGPLSPYQNPTGATALPVSGYIDELIITAPSGYETPEEAIYVTGDLVAVRRAFMQAVEILDVIAEDAVKAGKLDPHWKTKGLERLIRWTESADVCETTEEPAPGEKEGSR